MNHQVADKHLLVFDQLKDQLYLLPPSNMSFYALPIPDGEPHLIGQRDLCDCESIAAVKLDLRPRRDRETDMDIKRILCPTDFSETAKESLEYAVFLASSHDAALHLLHVVDQLHGFDNYQLLVLPPQEIRERMEKHAYESLGDLADQIEGSVGIEKVVKHGKTSVEIIEAADEIEADLIVMGSHGRTGLAHVLIGSVAEAVVRHAHCPVLIVRSNELIAT